MAAIKAFLLPCQRHTPSQVPVSGEPKITDSTRSCLIFSKDPVLHSTVLFIS
ncbi:hypothetical protein GLOTRDRAFT_112746 [Gloeophyllum trabeum ATCC 11539]|uniref:Uncharacterized protein n=1 Tax=Gloeophyllum trabeum (strain ATCC 11539 / FP-39264 / Madison 617) TaxID=670483 RepID=S7PSC3_GLOTA|nr:uncharacterized protein GLOTRDRAFT_112746 [Gloeophyllum trabeum ATCC 11539]EPQ50292.1 hypothetical protein GLOTRDRAFT_112746 [Gloeophyllum trabeum ATCC 11539]